MGRRKNQFMDDNDSSGDSSQGGDDNDDPFDPDDDDAAAERELFRNPYSRGHKRGRDEQGDRDEGDWGADPGDRPGRGGRGGARGRGRGGARGGKAPDYLKGQSFVSAGAKASPNILDNLSTTLPLEAGSAEQQDDDDVPMELDSDVDSDVQVEPELDDEREEDEYDEEYEDEQLAPVPGLAASPPPVEPKAALAFAPRAAARGKGGIGARPATAGIGSSSTSSTPLQQFASATSASSMPLGGAESPMSAAAPVHAGLGAGIGARSVIGGGGIGSGRQSLVDSLRQRLAVDSEPSSSESTPRASPEPSSSDPPRDRRSFLPTAKVTPMAPPPKISAKEAQHFAQLASKGDLGLRMLEKMGWKSGTGLGANQQGIVTPIGEGTKMRKQGAGISKGERSAGSIAEERRRKGLDPEEDEVEQRRAKRAPKVAAPKIVKDAWQQPKRKEAKVKIEYKTYEQIVAESGGEPEGVGMLVDLSGNALPSDALSLPAYGAGSADPTRLPELRHNLSLLTSTISLNLAALAREGKGVEERRAYINHEEARIRAAVEKQEAAIERLESVSKVVLGIKEIEKEMMALAVAEGGDELPPKALLSPFDDEFDELLGKYPEEYIEMKMDEVVVGAVAPIVRRLLQNWDPLGSPSFAVAELKRWRRHFLVDKTVVKSGTDVGMYGSVDQSNGGSSAKASDRQMTAYETMMWSIWLPRVRSAINNAWSPSDPTPAVALFTSWSPILPSFILDNVLDQLILPKLSKAIADWSPSSIRKGGAALHTIVFPWLEHAGDRMEGIMDEAKRKVRSWLKAWKAIDGVPKGIDAWKEAFSPSDWDTLVLKHVLPQLGATLRDAFSINPRAQELEPLEAVLAWSTLLRSSMMSQLIEGGFFPKWLDALYVWLTSDGVNFEQVAEWYSYWKSYFPEAILALSGVSRGFRKGLDLMNQAMSLGDDVKYRLKRPDTTPAPSSTLSHKSSRKPKAPLQPAAEVSFRTIVEEVAAAANLIFLPTGKSHERGYALFRVSQTVDGKGATVYLDADVVYILDGGTYRPVSVEEMCRIALG